MTSRNRRNTPPLSGTSINGRSIQSRIAQGVSAEEQKQLLTAIAGLISPQAPLLAITGFRRRVDESPENGSVRLIGLTPSLQTMEIDTDALSNQQKNMRDMVMVVSWRVMEILATHWPQYAAPEQLTILSDGHALVFCPESATIIQPGAKPIDERFSAQYIVLMPHNSALPKLLMPLHNGSSDNPTTIQ
jgi:hypothetical protein